MIKHKLHEVKLKNGAKGLFLDIPDASVMTFDFNFRAGDFLCSKDKWETAHLLEHLAFGANKKYRNGSKFKGQFEKNGAYTNAGTGTHNINYEAEAADFEWERIFKLATLSISQPIYTKEDFLAESGNVREELAMRSNNHWAMLQLELEKRLGLPAQTYLDGLKTLDNITIQDIRDYFKKTHFASNLRFVIAGKLPKDRRTKIVKTLESLPFPEGPSERFETHKLSPVQLSEPQLIKNKTVDNIYFYMTSFNPRRLTEAELHALNVANNLLTGTWTSWILGEARNKGWAYHVDSGVSTTTKFSHWWVAAQISRKNAPKLFELIGDEVYKMMNGKMSLEDLQSSKQNIIGRFQRGAQTVGGLANGYANDFFWDDKVYPYYQYPDQIKAVSRDRATAVFKEMFEAQNWAIGFLGNISNAEATKLHKIMESKIWR